MADCEARFVLSGSEGVTAYCTHHGALATGSSQEDAEAAWRRHVRSQDGRPLDVDDPRRIAETMTVLGTALREAGPWWSDALYESINHAMWALGR